MSGVDSDIANSALRLWVAAGSAALLVGACVLTRDWVRNRTLARIGTVLVGAVLGATLAWALFTPGSVSDRGAERRALESRAAALNAESLAPGSPLACLNGLAGDKVETACEKALFASAATVASATSYVAARLSLLSDVAAYTARGGHLDGVLRPLRRSLESDRFGFVAHALAIGDGCTSQHCDALALLDHSTQVRANLSGQTLDRYLERYLDAWAEPPSAPLADAGTGAVAAAQPASSPPHKLVNIDFPNSASIPAISIMNPEPKGPPAAAAVASATAGETNGKDAARRPHKPPLAPAPPPPQAAAALAPSSSGDPVWMPGTEPLPPVRPKPAPAPSAPAPAPPAGGAPMQLAPFAAAPAAPVPATQ